MNIFCVAATAQVSDEGVLALCEAIPASSLASLDICDNDLSPATIAAIKQVWLFSRLLRVWHAKCGRDSFFFKEGNHRRHLDALICQQNAFPKSH